MPGSQWCEWWPCAWGRGRRSRGRRLLGDRETFGMVASALQRLSWVDRESYFRYITPPWVVFHSPKKQFANRTSTYELPSCIHNYALVEVYKLRTVVTRRGKHVKVNGGMSCTIDLNNWWHKKSNSWSSRNSPKKKVFLSLKFSIPASCRNFVKTNCGECCVRGNPPEEVFKHLGLISRWDGGATFLSVVKARSRRKLTITTLN